MTTMAFRRIESTYVVVYGTANPTDEEWNAYLKACEEQGFDKTRQLVITDGGGPDARQRGLLNEMLGGKSVPVAVVTPSKMTRGVVTALSWFNDKIKAFQPTEFPQALKHLSLDHEPFWRNEVNKLRALLGLAAHT